MPRTPRKQAKNIKSPGVPVDKGPQDIRKHKLKNHSQSACLLAKEAAIAASLKLLENAFQLIQIAKADLDTAGAFFIGANFHRCAEQISQFFL